MRSSEQATQTQAEEVCALAGLTYDRLLSKDWGLSSHLWVAYLQDDPVAIVKQNKGFVGRFHAERSALRHLEGLARVPHLMAETTEQGPPTLLLSWVPNAQAPPHRAADGWHREAGVMIAKLHQIDASTSQMRLAQDPIPLNQRLLIQAEKASTRIQAKELAALARRALAWMSDRVGDVEFVRRCVHRDLRPPNFVFDAKGAVVGLVDFEHAAATDPAWDFAKVERWLAPEPRALQSFEQGYATIRPLPLPATRAIFLAHEAVTMLGFFESRNATYVRESVTVLENVLKNHD